MGGTLMRMRFDPAGSTEERTPRPFNLWRITCWARVSEGGWAVESSNVLVPNSNVKAVPCFGGCGEHPQRARIAERTIGAVLVSASEAERRARNKREFPAPTASKYFDCKDFHHFRQLKSLPGPGTFNSLRR